MPVNNLHRGLSPLFHITNTNNQNVIKTLFRRIILGLSLFLFLGCKVKPYSFTEKPVILKHCSGSAGKKGQYVLFGDWPQTIKSSKVTIDESSFIDRGAFRYYSGSDGNFYVKTEENAYNASSVYSDGSSVVKKTSTGEKSFKYFKVEPIKWRILSGNYNNKNELLLLADSILESGIPFYPGTTDRIINNRPILANNYEYSTMRAFLNGGYLPEDTQFSLYKAYVQEGKGFFQTAFTEEAQKLILTTIVDNSSKQMSIDGTRGITKAYACNNTFDKVFLPSTLELISAGGLGFPEYLVTSSDLPSKPENSFRIRKASDYALARGVYQSVVAGCGGSWWTRSPGYHSNFDIRFVLDTGKLRSTDYVYDKIDGIVPAICIDKNTIQ